MPRPACTCSTCYLCSDWRAQQERIAAAVPALVEALKRIVAMHDDGVTMKTFNALGLGEEALIHGTLCAAATVWRGARNALAAYREATK